MVIVNSYVCLPEGKSRVGCLGILFGNIQGLDYKVIYLLVPRDEYIHQQCHVEFPNKYWILVV